MQDKIEVLKKSGIDVNTLFKEIKFSTSSKFSGNVCSLLLALD